ncbi:MAG: hypothetical protein JKY65_11530 [Planctomycetes bacterium]|nr:hypothetical protein [Planctomycetota bacterium]
MAYVRQRGNQLAIVHGQRDPETKKVEQRVLFTIYSQPEALELLGKGGKGGRYRFESFMEHEYPELRFDWKKIHAAVAEKLDALPETYEYKAERLQSQFRADLRAFTRQLALADPRWLFSSAQLIKSQRHELTFLRDLIDWRLQTCDEEEDEWNRDDPFYWRFALTQREVPCGVEEFASELYEKGQDEEAESLFLLLIECFDGYAEGHNYLGLIALGREDLNEAISLFERTMELGRRKFPRRTAKKDYWSLLETRPYMRGLRNLCLTLNRAGRYDEALTLCDRLDSECGDDITADAHRASIYLNMAEWEQAIVTANRLHQLFPEENMTAALAAFELGKKDEATWRFLHGALNKPRAARMLLGLRTRALSSRGHEEVTDHNAGVSFRHDLGGFLAEQRAASKRFFRKILNSPAVVELLEEKAAVHERWSSRPKPEAEWRAAFDRKRLMETPEFSRDQAGLLSLAGPTGSAKSKKTKAKKKTKRRTARSR